MRDNTLVELRDTMRSLGDLQKSADMVGGWLKSVRSAIGLSAGEMGCRLGVTRQSIGALERRENDGSITLETLRRAAKALNMELVYGFAPIDGKLKEGIWHYLGGPGGWGNFGHPEDDEYSFDWLNNCNLLVEYHQWAHEKIKPVLRELTEEEWSRKVGGSFPTLSALYQHMLQADYRWLQRWNGMPKATIPPDYVVQGYADLERLFWPQLREMVNVAMEVEDEDPRIPVQFITGGGLDVTQPFWQTLYQVVNHGTYHRGQVTSILRVLGKQPVATDIFLFFLEKSKG